MWTSCVDGLAVLAADGAFARMDGQGALPTSLGISAQGEMRPPGVFGGGVPRGGFRFGLRLRQRRLLHKLLSVQVRERNT